MAKQNGQTEADSMEDSAIAKKILEKVKDSNNTELYQISSKYFYLK